MIPEDLKERIINVIAENLDLERCMLILFGSEARGKSTPRSDIDLGIDCTEPIPDEIFLEIEGKLNEELDILGKIDLVELKELSEDFLIFALKEAVIWHVGRDYLRNWIKPKEHSRS